MKKRWFARGGDIAYAGPFDTYDQALNSMRLVKGWDRVSAIKENRNENLHLFPDNIFIWSESVSSENK